MTHATRAASVLAGAVGFSLTSSFAVDITAQNAPASGTHVRRYGEVTLREIPPQSPYRGPNRSVAFRPPHAEVFNHGKQAAHNGEPLVAPPSTATTASPTVSINDSGFDGVSFRPASAGYANRGRPGPHLRGRERPRANLEPTDAATMDAVLQFWHHGKQSLTTYYYVVTAVKSGVESGYSNQASAKAK